MEDKDLLKQWKNGEKTAPFALEKDYHTAVHGIFIATLRSKAEIEECEKTFFTALVAETPPKKARYLKTYICRQAKIAAKKKQDANPAKNRDTLFSLCAEELKALCWTQTGETKRRNGDFEVLINTVNRFLKRCGTVNRSLFIRRYWHCDTVSDLSEKFGKSEHNLKKRLGKMRKQLEKQLMKKAGAVTLAELSEAMLYIKDKYIRASFF